MALAPFVQASQGQLIATATSAVDIRLPQAQLLVAANFPAEFTRVTQGQLIVAATGSLDVQVSQAQLLVAALGRIANPRLRAWTFSLDGHNFYVLRLGDRATLVYDVYSKQWVDWADLDGNFWRPNVGMNWSGGAGLGNEYGSNVLVGDDTFGLLWFLDPDQPYDEHPDEDDPTQEIFFDRITMGQVPIRGREVLPCNAVWLTTDMGDPAYVGAGVTLSISDDAGVSFTDRETITVVVDETVPPGLVWRSLGQISAPGRLFKITDDGAITRIDGLEMNDPE